MVEHIPFLFFLFIENMMRTIRRREIKSVRRSRCMKDKSYSISVVTGPTVAIHAGGALASRRGLPHTPETQPDG